MKYLTLKNNENKKKYKKLKLVQGLNNQWNEASIKMQELLNDKENFGELMIGNCTMWADRISKVKSQL